jgi:two-component system sensor histidine kinase HydH
MDARDQSRAFDDFFTTKAGGMGLGLPFVRRVAHAHGGHVSISSRVGRGTLVSFQIPAKNE